MITYIFLQGVSYTPLTQTSSVATNASKTSTTVSALPNLSSGITYKRSRWLEDAPTKTSLQVKNTFFHQE